MLAFSLHTPLRVPPRIACGSPGEQDSPVSGGIAPPGRGGVSGELLEVRDLTVSFHVETGRVRALFGVSFSLSSGETLGLVGESGCGKTVTALSLLKLLPSPPAVIEKGTVFFRGRDLIPLPEERMCDVRGKEISMIFQEPMTSLNPVLTIGTQVAEVFTAHRVFRKAEAAAKAVEWLRRVRMPDAERRAREYPHQMSGGMRQRAMIAMALALNPTLLIADEPTTALDVTIQAQILSLLKEMREQQGMAVLLITHDLGVVSEFADRVAIMYLGRIVEIAKTDSLFGDPVHPYTQGLLRSLPGMKTGERRLPSIPGMVPDLDAIPPGCPFADRCPFRQEAQARFRAGEKAEDDLSVCDRADPPLEEYSPGHFAACHYQKAARKGGRE
jgi:peptide/nickel transport system ATP-binding protein